MQVRRHCPDEDFVCPDFHPGGIAHQRILIFRNTYKEHPEHLHRVLQVLLEKKLYAKEFMLLRVTFLWFTVCLTRRAPRWRRS